MVLVFGFFAVALLEEDHEESEQASQFHLFEEAFFALVGLFLVKLALPHFNQKRRCSAPPVHVGGALPSSQNATKSTGTEEPTSMQKRQEKHDATSKYNSMIEEHVKKGSLVEAERLLHQMQIEGLHVITLTYNSLLHANAQTGQLANAESCFRHMVECGVNMDTVSYNIIIDCCSKAGKVKDAEAWLQKLVQTGTPPNTISYSTVIHACVTSGNTARAEKWLVEMQSRNRQRCEGPQSFCYNSIIQALARDGKTDRAAAWLKDGESVGADINKASYMRARSASNAANHNQPIRPIR